MVVNEATGQFAIEKASTTPEDTLVGVLNAIDKAGVDLGRIGGFFVHGSTTGLNAMLERKGVKTAFITTRGFRDVPEIMRYNRPEMYNPKYRKPMQIVPRSLRFEVTERMNAKGEVLTALVEDDIATINDGRATVNQETKACGFPVLISNLDIRTIGAGCGSEDFYTDRDGYAVFGQAILRPIEGVELTGGLRYANEGVKIAGERLRNITQIENAAPTFFILDGRQRFDNISWLGSASYKVNGDVLLYATASRGFKAGGFNRFPSQATAALPYESETSTNYELGLKASLLDRRLTANLSAFLIDIQGQQLLTVTNDGSGVPVTTIANAGQSRSKGLEAELFARPVDGLNLSASVAYTDARYVAFSQCAAAGVCISRNGHRFSYVPQWTVALNGEYRVPVGERSDVSFAANYRHVSSRLVDNSGFLADLGEAIPVPAYGRLDLRASYSHDGWTLTGYVNNVTDSYDYVNVAYNSFLPEVPANLLVVPLAPRTFGAMLSYKF